MKISQHKIDKLAKKKRVLALKKETIMHKMHERNSKRETKIKVLENKSYNDKIVAERRCLEIDRELEKTVRDIESEQIYVNQVAESEKAEYKQARGAK